ARSMPLAIERLMAAARIDSEHAGLQYSLGKCLQQVGRLDEAREALLRAKDEDICPLRMTGGLRRRSMDVAERAGVPMIDLVPIFTERSKGGILGPDWLVDHVHPSIAGHKLIARVLLDRLIEMGVVTCSPGWESRRDARYQKQMASLSDLYYLKGQDRLERLQYWAAGRARRLRKPQKPPASTTPSRPDSISKGKSES
ncbi:MAG TPA: SGNH/GDSL hydrolase family protein, partial [Isosphaeraceae bacterium]|nr:SGNH/GDSL hydrolase family protein [Isosphaeraceae bacterium]